MMRVLTQEHVADPTKIEAKVRREMMARQLGHERSNAERKLSDEARREKLEKKKEADEARGVHAAAFK
jgi:U4/U6 small nuclear ribonucleoprotein PRP3